MSPGRRGCAGCGWPAMPPGLSGTTRAGMCSPPAKTWVTRSCGMAVGAQNTQRADDDSAGPPPPPNRPRAHDAPADTSSSEGVIARLHAHGFTAIPPPHPPRGLAVDSDYPAGLLGSIQGPIVLGG